MIENNKHNDLQEILTQALNELKNELGEKFDINKVNLAELERRTGITRGKLRALKANNFEVKPHGLTGKASNNASKISGFTGTINGLLSKGIVNSSVIFDRISENGYKGSLSSVKDYINNNKNLVPAKRQLVAPREIVVEDIKLNQENLFIGMIHAFIYMGIPKYVLTDNMKSVVIKRDTQGKPIWQKDYEVFMNNLCFETKLCKPRHPFTKGAVERLVRFVKENFLPGRIFTELTDLNYEALSWCNRQNSLYHRAVDCIPNEKHTSSCLKVAPLLEESIELSYYLCPERCISFDGFVTYEGRRFGVPYWYTEKTCRVKRDGYVLYIYDLNMTKTLTTHDVTWSRKDSTCRDQYVTLQPEEVPSVPVKVKISQMSPPSYAQEFSRFNFEEGLE